MSARPAKHSLTLRGHRTSVTLEEAFWQALRDEAARRGIAVNALAAEIDAARAPSAGLASAIRVHLLRVAQGQAFSLGGARPDSAPITGRRGAD